MLDCVWACKCVCVYVCVCSVHSEVPAHETIKDSNEEIWPPAGLEPMTSIAQIQHSNQ